MRFVLTRREPLDSPDGVNLFIIALAQALCDLAHEVRIVVGSLQDPAEYRRLLAPRRNLPIFALSREPLAGVKSAMAWLRAKQLIDRFKPDLIIHNEALPLPLRGKTAQVVHDLEPRGKRLAAMRRGIRRFCSKRSTYVIASTSELRDELVRDLGLPAEQITIIPKCIDLQAYHGARLTDRERAIFHAGTAAYKNPGVTIEAFGVLDDPSVTLYIAGEITEPTRQAVAALPEHLRKHVTLLGPADGCTVRALHGRVRTASFPTRYAVPVASATVMEAVASRTPVVGSPRISRDLLAHEVNGLAVDANPSAMASALWRVLNDDGLWLRLSAGAGKIVEKFDAFRVARQYIELASGHSSPQFVSFSAGHRVGSGGRARSI